MAGIAAPRPWEQQPGEIRQAFEAFRVYLELESRRSVLDAYRQKTGKKLAKQAGGNWNAWAKTYKWAERAKAYDEHQAGLHQQGIEEVTIRQGREWAERRDRAYRDLAERWEKRLKQSDVIAAMPLTTQTVERDGKVIVIQPVDVLDHYRAVQMASRAQQRYVEVLDRGLALEAKDIEKTASETIPVPSASPLDLGDEPSKLDRWRNWQREQVIKIRRTDPRGDVADGSQTNGTGAH